MFKGALSRHSVLLYRFFAVENGSEETRGHGADQKVIGPWPQFFFLSPVQSFAIDRRRSISQLPLQSHSSLSDEVGL